MAGRSGISIDWGGFRETVSRATGRIGDTKHLMEIIGAAMKAQTQERFSDSESPEGEAWKPLAGPRKRGSKSKAKPLVDSGRLRASISFSATPTEVHVGSNLEYSRIHQLGGQAGRGRRVTIPARPYLGLSEDNQEEIADLVAEHIRGSFE